MPRFHPLLATFAFCLGTSAVAGPAFKPAGPDLAAVTITAADLNFSDTAQNIAPLRFDAAHGFERSLANPTLTALTLNGVPYVYMLMRVERETEQGNRLILARIPADKFSDGATVTPFSQWEAVPDATFTIVPPNGSKGVLNAAMAAHDGKLVITYQARAKSKNGADNLGFMVLFDPVAQKTLWTKSVLSIPGYAGTQKPTGLTRVTVDPVGTSGDYFASTKGRLVVGFMCRQDRVAACTDNGRPWNGFVLQELILSPAGDPQFRPPVRVLAEEVPDAMTVKAWARQGQTVWKKQSFNFGNGGSDTLIFSVNFNLVTADSPDHPAARDFPTHSKFFALTGLSALLDAANSGPIDASAKAPLSKTWLPDLSNNSPWDQGALWNSMFYIDPYHANRKFVLYESWGADDMQASQTRNALYGGSSFQTVKPGRPEFSQSCDEICGTSNLAGGGARKPYCLSATASAPGTPLQGAELPHTQPLDQVHDPLTGQGIAAATVMCSDIGTSSTRPGNLVIVSGVAEGNQTALHQATTLCAANAALGVIWIDAVVGKTLHVNLADTETLHQGDALTVACSTKLPSSAFHRDVQVQGGGTSCDMTCDALGTGDGTGFRAYRATLEDPANPGHSRAINPFTSLDLLASTGKAAAPQNSSAISCGCGPGREMRGVASARVAP